MGYHFLDLSKEEKHERRHLLDWYGLTAQASILAPLLTLQLYFLAVWIDRRWRNRNEFDAPSSPPAKREQRGGKSGLLRTAKNASRQILWWNSDPVDVLGCHLGSKGDVLGAAIWTVWLLFLCFPQTGEDYLHLAKRFGAIGASQLPLQYLLAFKSPYSPLQLLTRSSHETLNCLHQHLGYIITGFFYTHVALYVNFYVVKNLLAEKLLAGYILAGVFSVVAFTAIGTTALAPVRRWSYRVFYVVHVALATLLLPVLFFHVSHVRLYLYETAAVYAVNAVLRLLNTKTYDGTLQLIPDTGLLEIVVQLPKSALSCWEPGHHAYVSLAGHPLNRTFKSNPFTVASLPAADGHLKFVAKILDGNTAKLARSMDNIKHSGPGQQLSIEGPYGLGRHGNELLRYDRILFVAGGVGATFVLPLYRQLLADLSPSKGSYRRQKVQFLWIARSKAEIIWSLPENANERQGFAERLSVYLTGPSTSTGSPIGSSTVGDGEDGSRVAFGEPAGGIELEEKERLLVSDVGAGARQDTDEVAIHAGRPNLRKVVDQTFAYGTTERVAVIVCGPLGLSQALREEVGRYVRRGREVWFWEEKFAF